MDHGCRCHGQRGLINVNISNHGRWLVADTERYTHTPAVALCVFKVSRGKLSIQYIGSIQRVSKNIWQYHNNDISNNYHNYHNAGNPVDCSALGRTK